MDLIDINTNEVIRLATKEEEIASKEAEFIDGGVGAIVVDGRTCYVA